MTLWTRTPIATATSGHAQGDWNEISGVSIDTRTLQPGDLFVALKDVRDGHEFVAQALEKGAAAALVSHFPEGCPPDANLLIVDDPLFALETIGELARGRASDLKAIAVTGSVGKTSVKEALRAVLTPQGPTHASEKSYNNHWGVPLTLARMPQETRFGVFEIGMNHTGEITPLTRMVRPHVAVVTTVAPAHLGNFASEQEIAEAKAEVFLGLQGGTAVINRDIPWFGLLVDAARTVGAKIVGFGQHESAEARLITLAQQATTSTVEADIMGERVLYRLTAPGRHHAMNSLAVLSAAVLAGADLARAALALNEWTPGDGRGSRSQIRLDPIDPASSFLLIDESYNANPVSVRAALEILSLAEPGKDRTGRPGRRIAVIGDMLELGPRADELHASLAEDMGGIDTVYACGPHSRALYDALPFEKRGDWQDDSGALAPVVNTALCAGDVVMIKGSLGSKMARIVDLLKTARVQCKRA